jgi:hypothetical protein
MQGAGLHEDTDVPSLPAGSRLVGVNTVVGLAVEYERLAADMADVNARLAAIVRDGGADALPATSAVEVMSAVGLAQHQVTVAAALGLGQVEVTHAHIDDGIRSAALWVERHAGMSSGTVSELRRVNRALERYPVVAAAFLEGRLRSAELAVIDKIIPHRFRGEAKRDAIEFLTGVQSELIAGAEAALSLDEFGRFAKQVQDRIDSDGPEPKVPGDGDSEIRVRERSDGWWDLVGLLNPDDGAVVSTLLEERDLKNRRSRQDDPELKGVKDDRTREARHAAALIQLLMAGAADGRPGRVGLYLNMDLNDLATLGADTPTPKAKTMAGYDITDDTLWGLLADADLTPIITSNGTPLSYGRTRRLAPHMLRMALAFRDNTCWVPGCDAGPNCHHIHHLKWWEHGGNTNPDETKGGCGFHHHLVHDHGWTVLPPPDGEPGKAILIKPDGTVFDPMPEWRKRRQAPERDAVVTRLDALRAEFPDGLRDAS